MKVYVDDYREPYEGWVLAKTFDEAIQLLKTGLVEELSLDNDLGEGAGRHGTDIANWLEEQVHEGNIPAPRVMIAHTDNGSARKTLNLAFESIRRIAER